jgi:hypothetical protein
VQIHALKAASGSRRQVGAFSPVTKNIAGQGLPGDVQIALVG